MQSALVGGHCPVGQNGFKNLRPGDMHQALRLRANADFRRVREEGQTFVHPLLVMSVLPNNLEYSRFGFAIGRRVGKAVERNRLKRQLREAVRLRVKNGNVVTGWDVIFIARSSLRTASYHEADQAIGLLLQRAGLIRESG